MCSEVFSRSDTAVGKRGKLFRCYTETGEIIVRRAKRLGERVAYSEPDREHSPLPDAPDKLERARDLELPFKEIQLAVEPFLLVAKAQILD